MAFSIKEFQDDVRELSQRLDTKTPEQRILYLISELGEVADEMLELSKSGDSKDQEMIKKRLGMEIYDVIWNAVDLANQLNLDLEDAFIRKIAINKNRVWQRSGELTDDK
ncbi:MAG: MazG nucleotide pyrophosphohydrolase domain-containing protein [Chloroflexota bacterium]